MTESDLLHNAIESLKTLAGSEQEIYLKRGEIISLLKTSKLYKGSFRRFLVESGICDILGKKPSCLEQNARVVLEFGAFINDEGLRVVPSRCAALLPYRKDKEKALGLIRECALTNIPDSTFQNKMSQLKTGKEIPICTHEGHGFEVWHKWKCCGQWTQESLARDE